MLDYSDVKRKFAEKLAADPDGVGRFESAFYHTMKWVYEQGVEDGRWTTPPDYVMIHHGALNQMIGDENMSEIVEACQYKLGHVGINDHRG